MQADFRAKELNLLLLQMLVVSLTYIGANINSPTKINSHAHLQTMQNYLQSFDFISEIS